MFNTYLLLAIFFEVIATTALKASDQFSNKTASSIVVIGYVAAFYCLTLVLKTMPLAIAYAIWSAIGLVIVTINGWIFFGEVMDIPALIGMALIIIGICVIHMGSKVIA
ncbi:MAG: multidrug efflux SMR transporter [Cellvibrionales bacterium]|nr:multidrug efflux SMR transporter [Cellvibrionales bacterium]